MKKSITWTLTNCLTTPKTLVQKTGNSFGTWDSFKETPKAINQDRSQSFLKTKEDQVSTGPFPKRTKFRWLEWPIMTCLIHQVSLKSFHPKALYYPNKSRQFLLLINLSKKMDWSSKMNKETKISMSWPHTLIYKMEKSFKSDLLEKCCSTILVRLFSTRLSLYYLMFLLLFQSLWFILFTWKILGQEIVRLKLI